MPPSRSSSSSRRHFPSTTTTSTTTDTTQTNNFATPTTSITSPNTINRPQTRSSTSTTNTNTEPNKSRKPRPSALVVGAGLSGLACALELKARGWDVIVIEARDRCGGRIHTTNFLNGAAVDMGASFIHGINDNPVADIALQRGVNLYERLTCPLYDGVTGNKISPALDQKMETVFNNTLAKAAERKSNPALQHESLETAFLSSLPYYQSLVPLERRILHWHLSNLEYSVNADLKMVRNVGWDADDAFGLDGPHTVVGGARGMSCVVDALSEKLNPGTELLLNKVVSKIDYSNGLECVVHVRPSSTHARLTSEAEIYHAHAVIVTVPLGVLKTRSITFTPSLPAAKTKAISQLGFGLLNKIMLLFPTKFWGDDDDFIEIFGICAANRGETPLFVDGSHDGFPILVVLVSGTPAVELESSSATVTGEVKLIASLMTTLRRVFSHVGEIPEPLEYSVTRWKSDEFARGSYSYVAVDSSPDDYDLVAACVTPSEVDPLPRVFFAGEATSRLFPASVHGAFFSGVREAIHVSTHFGGRAVYPMHDFKFQSRMYVPAKPFHEDDVTPSVFRSRYAPKRTFVIDKVGARGGGTGIVFPSGTPGPISCSKLMLNVPLGRHQIIRNKRRKAMMGGDDDEQQSAPPPSNMTQLKPGTLIKVEWQGKFYPAIVVPYFDPHTNSLSLNNKIGVYYVNDTVNGDASFEQVDLKEVAWQLSE